MRVRWDQAAMASGLCEANRPEDDEWDARRKYSESDDARRQQMFTAAPSTTRAEDIAAWKAFFSEESTDG